MGNKIKQLDFQDLMVHGRNFRRYKMEATYKGQYGEGNKINYN